MPISEKKRRRWQLAGAILMFFGVVMNVYRYFLTEEGGWTQLIVAVCFLFSGTIFFLQSKDIIKSG